MKRIAIISLLSICVSLILGCGDAPVGEALKAKLAAGEPVVNIAVAYAARPAYTNGQYYVWSVEAVATNGLNAINGSGWFPITGRNAKTGAPEPNKAKTTSWCTEVLERVDGKFVLPRIPEATLNALGVPEAERKAWWDAFEPDVEEYQDDWFPVVE